MIIGIIEIKEDYFTKKWKDYCEKKEISYFVIQSIDIESYNKLKKATFVLWHWNLMDFENYQIAREFITCLDLYNPNLEIYPNFNTIWHYDDKLSQSIILELINAPQPKFWFFFKKKDAIKWLKTAKFPLVFKLRKGAGTSNVKLLYNKKEAIKITKKMFSRGIRPAKLGFKDVLEKKNLKKVMNYGIKNGILLYLSKKRFPREKNYVYFQEYIPYCEMDIRIIVIRNMAYGFNRYMRKGNFGASGSGKYLIDHDNIEIECIKIAFEISKKLNLQCAAFDFLKSEDGFKILEISYDFVPTGGTYNGNWHGYWDEKLEYHKKEVDPVILMIESLFN